MDKYENLIGKRYDQLIVKEYVGVTDHQRNWLCECDCGRIKVFTTHALNDHRRKHFNCGCLKYRDLKGKRFGDLLVVKLIEIKKIGKNFHQVWLCKCNCGGYMEVTTSNLNRGGVSSCGCKKNAIRNRDPQLIKIDSALYSYKYLQEYEPQKATLIYDILNSLDNREQLYIMGRYFEKISQSEVMVLLNMNYRVYRSFRDNTVLKFEDILKNA